LQFLKQTGATGTEFPPYELGYIDYHIGCRINGGWEEEERVKDLGERKWR
jgi:hypothetical protein